MRIAPRSQFGVCIFARINVDERGGLGLASDRKFQGKVTELFAGGSVIEPLGQPPAVDAKRIEESDLFRLGGKPGKLRVFQNVVERQKPPVLFGIGFCVLQLLVALARFGSMDSWNPAELLFAIPAILSGLILFFLGGLLIGLLAQRLLRGVVGSWRRGLWVAIAVATPLAVLLSLVGGLLGPHMVVLGALVPYLLLVGIPLLIRQFVQRLRSPPRPEE